MNTTITFMVGGEIEKQATEKITPLDRGTEDAALVAAAKGGDGRAFEVLVGRHQSRIRAIASRFACAPEDAEDIAQQSFQKAFVHLKQFEGNSAFSTWLTRITINEALMWARKRRAAREVPIEDSSTESGVSPMFDFPDPGPSPEDSYLQREWKKILFRAMNELTPGMRTAIELRHISELSTDETAGVMRLSVGAVKARIFHGRRKLRGILNRYVRSTHSRVGTAAATSREAKQAPALSTCSACD